MSDHIYINHNIKIITKNLNLKPKVKYKGGKRGWIGDSPFIYLDTKKIRNNKLVINSVIS